MTIDQADRTFLSKLNVLYVEDDPGVRGATTDFLQRRVGRLCVATDGVEGLEAFRRERPGLVVTDILMPRLDGLAMAEAMRAEAPKLPLVVTTAFELKEFLMRSIAIGVDRYVLKPVQPDLLDAALLHCAHQLRAEEELHQRYHLERQLQLARQREATGLLARGLAHDYSNLLQAILASVEAASRHCQSGSQAQLVLDVAQRYTGKAQSLEGQLLALGQQDGQVEEGGPLEARPETALPNFPGPTAIGPILPAGAQSSEV
jgi:YesN/AraC family two-component response regulator